jgi:hypothetical protein
MRSDEMGGDLEQDRRWLRLHDRAWTCPCCGESHGGVRDVACHAPHFWDGGEKRPNADLLSATHILTEDFCIIDGEHFFVRGVLETADYRRAGSEFRVWRLGKPVRPKFRYLSQQLRQRRAGGSRATRVL